MRQNSATSNFFTGLAAANQPSSAKAEPAAPVSFGVVMLGALLGAALGGLALLVRRGF